MAKLSLSRAWDETRGVLARDGKLIGTVALALFFLPGTVAGVVQPEPEGLPSGGSTLLLMAAVALIGVIGQLAIIRLALGGHSTVGEAIGHGARRAPAYIIASLMWVVPFILGLYLLGVDILRAPESADLGTALAALALLVGLIFLSVRMLMSSPIAGVETSSPIAILRRSWALTAGNWWRLAGFLIVFLLVALASLSAVGAVVGIASTVMFGEPQPMSLAALFNSVFIELVTTLITVGFIVMLARIYAQLAGPAHADVSVPSSGT